MKVNLADIKNIVFDLGNVLLNLDFDASIREFQKLGLNNQVITRQQAYADPIFYQLETGEVTPEQFRNRVREIIKNEHASDEQIDAAWSSMILDIPKNRVELLQKLKNNYRIILFSNTNKIHIDKLLSEFYNAHGIEFESLFDDVFYSYDIHDRKPEVSSFERVIKLAGISAPESVFIDDLEKNIFSAQKAGFTTFWLKSGMELTEIF